MKADFPACGRMTTHSEADTTAWAQTLGASLSEGDIVLLNGDLGAGKSVIARGIARGLGVSGAVLSPTFPILIAHEGRMPFYHFDAYRLTGREQWDEMGFDEYLYGGGGVCAVEWPQNAEVLPHKRIDVNINIIENARELEWKSVC